MRALSRDIGSLSSFWRSACSLRLGRYPTTIVMPGFPTFRNPRLSSGVRNEWRPERLSSQSDTTFRKVGAFVIHHSSRLLILEPASVRQPALLSTVPQRAVPSGRNLHS